MKIKRPFPAIEISGKAEKSVRSGHPWIYYQEIENMDKDIKNGDIADVFSKKGAYLGSGMVSMNSKIRVRLLSSNANDRFDEEFFRRRVKYAVNYRRTVMREDFDCCRLIFGEADGLPGITADRFGEILSTEILSYGMEQRKDWVYKALCDELCCDNVKISGIYERNESGIRLLEGLEQGKGWYDCGYAGKPESAVTYIKENGIVYLVDVENGQKTGFFLDQKYNRRAVAEISLGKRVLDCFTHTGSFALNAAKGGALHVTAVDISETALKMAEENAALNGMGERIDFICADVFDLLPKLKEQKEKFDFIILDPPAFTKSRRTIHNAEKGYKEINYRAMQLLPRGGYLATCSCSHFITDEMFRKLLTEAARDAGVSIKLVEFRRQGPDHPMLFNVPETDYLKFYILQII